MNSDAIILAGGFGTRLSGVAGDIPKPMAPVKGRPFLEFLLDYLSDQGIRKVILSTGYRSEIIEAHFGRLYNNIAISYSIEEKPLGTGGAIMAALRLASTKDCLVLNGDTLFRVPLNDLEKIHSEKSADISIALRSVSDAGRYGAVILDNNSRILSFAEKEAGGNEGLVNGGIYMLGRDLLESLGMPPVFSIEKELFAALTGNLNLFGMVCSSYFIDIGTPEDYLRANDELGR